MRRGGSLLRLAPGVLALFAVSTMPRAGWLVHHHAGGTRVHVHVDGDGDEGHEHRPGPAHVHARHDPFEDDHAADEHERAFDDDHAADEHEHAFDDDHAAPHHDDGPAVHARPDADHVHWLQPFHLGATLPIARVLRTETAAAVAAAPPSREGRLAAVRSPARAPPFVPPRPHC